MSLPPAWGLGCVEGAPRAAPGKELADVRHAAEGAAGRAMGAASWDPSGNGQGNLCQPAVSEGFLNQSPVPHLVALWSRVTDAAAGAAPVPGTS